MIYRNLSSLRSLFFCHCALCVPIKIFHETIQIEILFYQPGFKRHKASIFKENNVAIIYYGQQ